MDLVQSSEIKVKKQSRAKKATVNMKRVVESMHGDICAEVVYQLTMLECFLEPRSRLNKIMSKASLKQFHVFPKREESVIGRKRTSELHDNASGMT